MKKSIYGAATLAVAALTLAACGQAPSDDPTTTGGEDTGDGGSDVKACLVSDAGGFDDQSFNQAGFEGLQRAESELGIEINQIESASDADFGPNIDTMIQDGCTYVIGAGFLLEDAIQAAAEANPDVNFGLVDSSFSDPEFNPVELENGKPLLFNTAEAALLGGYVAASMSESGTIATYGGLPIPSVQVFMDGYSDGVDLYNEDTGSDVQLLGWDKEAQEGNFTGDFDNQANGQTQTQQFLAQGADVILPVAGPVGLGTGAALEAEGSGAMVWVDSDGFLTTDYGSLIITSVMKEIGAAVFDSIAEQVDGEFSNEPYVGTLENGGVGLAEFHDFEGQVPQEVVDRIAELEEQIISGELVVESPNSP